ncbi:MAG TPA: hypothetical protein VHH36_09870 [Candidatus Thermoplasmatota archaeon]|nr:hypothetical protein [Candidatus Thermoplasmatota archaeon]
MDEGGQDAYMEAFMNGFEFVLLAIRGRLAEAGLDDAERQRLEAFLADYWRISAAYRARRGEGRDALRVRGPIDAALTPVMAN